MIFSKKFEKLACNQETSELQLSKHSNIEFKLLRGVNDITANQIENPHQPILKIFPERKFGDEPDFYFLAFRILN